MASDSNEIVIFIDPDVFYSAGIPGPSGPAGSVWHSGDGPPDVALGKDTDYYLDNQSKAYYYKDAGSWTLLGTLSGTEDHNNLFNRNGEGQHEISAISGLTAQLELKLEDAPEDGKTYGRLDGTWSDVVIPQVTQQDYVISGTGAVQDDVNVFDFTGLIGSTGTALDLLPEISYRFTHNGNLYHWVGQKETSIGLGGLYTSVNADYTGSGTQNHGLLANLEDVDQHGIPVITGLQAALDAKADTVHPHIAEDIVVDMTDIDRLAGPGLQTMLEDIDEQVRRGSAILYGNTQGYILTAGDTPTRVDNYVSEDDLHGVADPVAGTISVATSGVYELTAHIWAKDTIDTKEWTLKLFMYRGAAGITLDTLPLAVYNVPASADNDYVINLTLPIIVTTDEIFSLAVQAEGKAVTLNLLSATFDLTWRYD